MYHPSIFLKKDDYPQPGKPTRSHQKLLQLLPKTDEAKRKALLEIAEILMR